MKERLVDIRSSLVAHQKPAVPRQPRQRALHHPPMPSEPLAGVFPSPGDAALDAATAQNFLAAREVVGLICVQFLGYLAWPTPAGTLDRSDGVHQCLKDLGVVYVGRSEHHSERNSVAVGKEVVLGAGLTTVGGACPDSLTPLLAGTLAESRLALDQSTLPLLPSTFRSARCRRRHTPAFCQSRSRRQQVTPLPKPISLGSIRQGMPLLRTKTMPDSTRRSGIRGLPPLVLDASVGSRGSTIRHSSSLTSSLLMPPSVAPVSVLKRALSTWVNRGKKKSRSSTFRPRLLLPILKYVILVRQRSSGGFEDAGEKEG